ncbi:MAG: FAD-dependent oxidoreductase [Desulfurococcales archaeon]|nr:FAD-dependent oxidoreductase [Desulfurococcales archaeon]
MPKNILILGGGTGGVVAALSLAEAKEKFGLDYEITLVNKTEWHYMPPLWMDVALGTAKIEETRAPIRGLEKYGVKVVVGEAVNIDPGNRAVSLADGTTLGYDYLFVVLGLRNGWEAIPGYAEEGYHNYSPEGALEFNNALKQFKGGKVVITVPEVPFRCGIYPMEFATVLAYKLSSKGIKPEITLMSPRMPNGVDITYALGPDIKRLWDKYFNMYGIKVRTHDGIEKIDGQRKVVVTKNYEEPYDLLIKVPPPRSPKVLEENPEFQKDPTGRFIVAKPLDFRHPKYDDIFLTGEHSMPPTGLGTAGVFIHAASYRATQILLSDEYGVGSPGPIPPVACVAYVADKGFLGVCEVTFDGQTHMWSGPRCYNVVESYLMKMVKHAFYQGWLDRLRL